MFCFRVTSKLGQASIIYSSDIGSRKGIIQVGKEIPIHDWLISCLLLFSIIVLLKLEFLVKDIFLRILWTLLYEACVAVSFANEELFLHSGLCLIFLHGQKGEKAENVLVLFAYCIQVNHTWPVFHVLLYKSVILHYAFASFKYLTQSILVNISLKGYVLFHC